MWLALDTATDRAASAIGAAGRCPWPEVDCRGPAPCRRPAPRADDGPGTRRDHAPSRSRRSCWRMGRAASLGSGSAPRWPRRWSGWPAGALLDRALAPGLCRGAPARWRDRCSRWPARCAGSSMLRPTSSRLTRSGSTPRADGARARRRSGRPGPWAGGGRPDRGGPISGACPSLARAADLLGWSGGPGRSTLSPIRLAWEPVYGRPAEAQAQWERTHGRPLADPTRA